MHLTDVLARMPSGTGNHKERWQIVGAPIHPAANPVPVAGRGARNEMPSGRRPYKERRRTASAPETPRSHRQKFRIPAIATSAEPDHDSATNRTGPARVQIATRRVRE